MRAGWGGRDKKEHWRDAYDNGGMTLQEGGMTQKLGTGRKLIFMMVGWGWRAKKEHCRDAYNNDGMPCKEA